MAEDTLGLGFARTLEISSWPRLEQQGLPVDSDEQHVTKKVKNRAASGLSASKGNARLMPSMDDVVVLDEDVIVDDSGPFTVIRFSDRVHDVIDQSIGRSLIVRLLGRSIGYRMLWNHIQALWAPQGNIQLVDLDKDYYLVKFVVDEDYVKVLAEGPWIIFGNYLTVQPWSHEFSTNQVFPSQVIVWVRLSGLLYHYYMKSLFLRITSILGRVVKVDYNTHGGERGKFARLAIILDLTKPIRSCIGIDGFIQQLEYERLHNIFFGCGNHSFPLANKQADKVSSKDLFGTWMLVEDRRRRTLRNDNAGKSMIKETSGSRFDILHNFPVEDETRDDNCLRGTSGEVSLGAYVVAMIPGRVPTVISKGSSGSTDQHQAITIVEEEDGREGGNGPVSQAGSKGFGKKKVQFKKKSELRISNRVLSSEWSDVVNICSDTSRQCDVVGDDVVLWVKSPDDPRSTIEMSTEGQAVADMVQSNEEMNPVLVVD
ncbi:hypothetical protein V6N12_030951 [Hibiscus sabdariffa]|uniref:DUF4283 domain-containing protein n=1 Tax=Hibiscus sabdariffa TaxID=183260 RepID=A0ABR2E7H4_9ROSI